MKKETVEERVIELLKSFNSFNVEIDRSKKLVEDIGLDSLTMLQLITLLEQKFNISILDNEINRKNFADVESLLNFILSKAT